MTTNAPKMIYINPNRVKCSDGSFDVNNGFVSPCLYKGGVMKSNNTEQPTDINKIIMPETVNPNKISNKLLGKNEGFGAVRMGNLLLYVAGGSALGFFASKPLKVSKMIGTVLGAGVVLVFFAGLNTYENLNEKK